MSAWSSRSAQPLGETLTLDRHDNQQDTNDHPRQANHHTIIQSPHRHNSFKAKHGDNNDLEDGRKLALAPASNNLNNNNNDQQPLLIKDNEQRQEFIHHILQSTNNSMFYLNNNNNNHHHLENQLEEFYLSSPASASSSILHGQSIITSTTSNTASLPAAAAAAAVAASTPTITTENKIYEPPPLVHHHQATSRLDSILYLMSNLSLDIDYSLPLALLLGLITLVTFVGNILVCLSVIRVRKLRHPANYLLISLAISDLCVACFVMPFGLYHAINVKWQLGRLLCNIYVVSDVTSCTASILNLCVISIDRYRAITKPLTYCIKRTTRLMLILIAIVWICACLISVPPLLITGNEYGTAEEPRCEVSQSLWYQLYATCISFYIPLFVMICLYYKIYTAARKVVEAEQRVSANYYTSMRERKASITLGVIMGAFAICWLPFFIIALVRPWSQTVNNIPRAFVLVTLWLGYANSMLNPIIYVTFHRDFRNAFKQLLCSTSNKCRNEEKH